MTGNGLRTARVVTMLLPTPQAALERAHGPPPSPDRDCLTERSGTGLPCEGQCLEPDWRLITPELWGQDSADLRFRLCAALLTCEHPECKSNHKWTISGWNEQELLVDWCELSLSPVCRKRDIIPITFCKLRAKYGGPDASELKRMRELEEENRRLKQMCADLSLDHAVLKEIIE